MARKGKKRPAKSKAKVLQRRRMLKGQEVLPIRAVSRVDDNKYDIIGGYIRGEQFAIRDENGRAIPFRQIGKLVWA